MKHSITISEKIKNKLTELIIPFNQISLNYSLDDSATYKKLGHELYQAIIKQDLPLIKQKLNSGANINYTPKNETPALQILLNTYKYQPKTKKIIHFLLENGANPNLKNSYGRTALHQSIYLFLPDMAKNLIDYKADVNATDNLGQTPLHFCAMFGFPELSKFLIQKGADINKQDTENKTPLYTAVEYYTNQVMLVLLKNNANCFTPSKNGVTPYIYLEAIKNSYSPVAYQQFHYYAQQQLKNILKTMPENDLITLPQNKPELVQGMIHYHMLHELRNKVSEKNQTELYTNLKKFHLSKNLTFIHQHSKCKHCKTMQRQHT